MAVRRHPLALLALLAAHRAQGMSRDKVVAYLWPESDAQRARNSLKQDCFSLRQALGGHVVICAQGTLRLDATLLDIDVWQFEAALAAGQPAAAVALYQGPFLDGFYLLGLDEFERWTEAERGRLAGQYSEALSVLAEEADQSGNQAAAIAWWRRLAALDPLSSRAAIGLMRALEASGDAAAALEHARRHAATVQTELGAPVPAEVAAVMGRLGANTRLPAPRWRPPPTQPPWPPPFRQIAATHPKAGLGAIPLATPTRPVTRLRGPPHWLMALLVGLAVLFAVSWARWVDREPVPAGPGVSATVTVLPFAVTGAPSIAALGAGLEELLAARLDGADRLRTVPVSSGLDRDLGRAVRLDRQIGAAIARRASARFYVMGRLVGTGNRLQATATLYDRGNANTPAARAEGTVADADLFELADELATQLIAQLYRVGDEAPTRLTPASTRSLPALKAYLEGERRFRADSFSSAVGAFRRAVRADTAFSLAYYRLSLAAERDGQGDLAQWAATMAGRFSEDRDEHERALVQAHLAYRRGRFAVAERLYRRLVMESPDDAESWFLLAEVLFHSNPARGRSITEARDPLERGLALEPHDREALVRLARIAALEGRKAEADSLARRAMAETPDSVALALRAFHTFVLGNRLGEEALSRELLQAQGLVPASTALRSAVYLEDLEGAERLAARLGQDTASCIVRALGQRMLSQISMARGRPRLAMTWLRAAGACDPAATLEVRVGYATLPFLRPDSAELATLRHALESPGRAVNEEPWMKDAAASLRPAMRRYYLGLLALRSGDTLQADRMVLALTIPADTGRAGRLAESLKRSLRAGLALARGRPQRALALLESAQSESSDGSIVEAGDRFLRAELLRELGREDEAIGWYRTIAERSLYELVYRAPAELRLAGIYERRGDHAEASVHYHRYRELWRQPEHPAEADVTAETARVGALHS